MRSATSPLASVTLGGLLLLAPGTIRRQVTVLWGAWFDKARKPATDFDIQLQLRSATGVLDRLSSTTVPASLITVNTTPTPGEI